MRTLVPPPPPSLVRKKTRQGEMSAYETHIAHARDSVRNACGRVRVTAVALTRLAACREREEKEEEEERVVHENYIPRLTCA